MNGDTSIYDDLNASKKKDLMDKYYKTKNIKYKEEADRISNPPSRDSDDSDSTWNIDSGWGFDR